MNSGVKRRGKGVQVATSSDEYVFFSCDKSLSSASSPIASKSPWMPIASVKPDSRMSVDPNSFGAASTSQVRLMDAYLGGLTENKQGNPSKNYQLVRGLWETQIRSTA